LLGEEEKEIVLEEQISQDLEKKRQKTTSVDSITEQMTLFSLGTAPNTNSHTDSQKTLTFRKL